MGQAVGTLLGKREDVNVPEGVESHYVVVDKTVFRRRVRLEFTLLHPKDQTEEEAEVERQEAAAAEAFASKVMIEEVSSQWSVVADEEGAAERTLAPGAGDDDLPPLAFVDENDEDHLACRPVGPVRRAHSTGTAPSSAAGHQQSGQHQQQQHNQRRPPRPQSVGALTTPGSSQGRLSLQSVTEAVCVGGKEMSRLRLSLVSRRRRPSEDVSGRADEAKNDEEEMVVLGTTSVLLPTSSEQGAEKGQRRCESVTVSLEAMANGEAAAAAEGGEAAVNVEIEQAEGLKPIEQLSAEQAAGVPIVQSSSELQLAVQRLCQSYSRDEHSPSVVASKRDVRIITAYLLRLIAPATTEGMDASEGPQLLSAGSSHSSLPPLPALPLQSPTPTTAAAVTPSQDRGEGHTPIPATPASPFGAEPIIEASGGAKPSTATATRTTMAAPVPPPKPVRRRKIRLSASEAELLGGPAGAGEEATGTGAMATATNGAEGLFDDLWGVEPSSSPKPKPAKAAGKKKLLAPEESATIPDHELSMWS